MMWAAIYVGLVLALFVRFQDPNAPVRPVPAPGAGEPLRLVSVHHALFYALLLAVCPLESAVVGGAAGGRVPGAIAFATGIALYRWGAMALGPSLSPLVTPPPGGRLVTAGPYRLVRHPMYLGQLLIALGAPATLGCRFAFAMSFAAAVVLFVRVAMEENALSRAYAEYPSYRARSKRLLPFVF
jgi:protein-S-isoprenylcysteine O-methyltransferase Ste14